MNQSTMVIVRSKIKRATAKLDDFEPLTTSEINVKFQVTKWLNQIEDILDEELADPEKFDKARQHGRRKK